MLLLLLLAAAPVGDVLETRLETAIEAEGPLEATVHYRLVLFEEFRRIPVGILEVGPAVVHDIEAVAAGTPLAVTLEPGDASQRRGYVELAAPARGALDLQIRYSVSSAVAREGEGLAVRLPVPVLDLPQAEARAQAFTAAVAVPSGFDVVESFPTGFARAGSDYLGSLPLVPAFVFLRIGPAGKVLTFERAVDWGVLVLLGGLGTLGLQRGIRALSK